MSWNYRLIYYGADVGFVMHEVYYDDDGNITSWSDTECAVSGESPEAIRDTLAKMMTTLARPALRLEEMPKPVRES